MRCNAAVAGSIPAESSFFVCEAERVQSPPASWEGGKERKVWHPQAVRSKLIIATLWSDVAQGKSGGLIAFFFLFLSSSGAGLGGTDAAGFRARKER